MPAQVYCKSGRQGTARRGPELNHLRRPAPLAARAGAGGMPLALASPIPAGLRRELGTPAPRGGKLSPVKGPSSCRQARLGLSMGTRLRQGPPKSSGFGPCPGKASFPADRRACCLRRLRRICPGRRDDGGVWPHAPSLACLASLRASCVPFCRHQASATRSLRPPRQSLVLRPPGTPWPALSSPCRLWRGGAPPPAPLGPACQGARQRDAWSGSTLTCLRHRLRTRQDGQGRQDDQSRQDGQCRQEGRSGSRPGVAQGRVCRPGQSRQGGAESQRFGSGRVPAWRVCRVIAAGRGLALSPLVRSALAESALRASGGMPAKAVTRRVTVCGLQIQAQADRGPTAAMDSRLEQGRER